MSLEYEIVRLQKTQNKLQRMRPIMLTFHFNSTS